MDVFIIDGYNYCVNLYFLLLMSGKSPLICRKTRRWLLYKEKEREGSAEIGLSHTVRFCFYGKLGRRRENFCLNRAQIAQNKTGHLVAISPPPLLPLRVSDKTLHVNFYAKLFLYVFGVFTPVIPRYLFFSL